MRVLNVAEKPSMARQISHFLAGEDIDSYNGKNKYCRNFLFRHEFQGQSALMVMTSVLGHVKELDFASGYSDWQRVPVEDLFRANIVAEINQKMRDVAENLCIEARKAQVLVIWTDCDREGEYIGSEIAQICQGANPKVDVYRARYSSLTRFELRRSLQNVSRLDNRLVAAAELRSEIDLRAGAAFTRLQTLRFRPRHSELADKIISYGSCQFPTLGFVVEQYLRVVNFSSEPFWSIQMDVQRDGKVTKFTWKRNRLFDRMVCTVLYERCLRRGSATITSVTRKTTLKWRPLPLRTVELQKLGSRFLKMSSDKIMEIAEKLYNKGYISYPRTETDGFDPGFPLEALLEKHFSDHRWGSYARKLSEGAFRRPRSGKNNDKAHPPIHPLKEAPELAGAEARVYEFVVRRFLACCSEDAKGSETVVLARIGEEEFKARGIIVEALNYLEVYTYESWTDQVIGNFSLNEVLSPTRLEMIEGSTTSPKLLSEPELIGTMDKNGIGTDATIHEHIKKIIERSYVMKNREARFHPTNLGLALVLGYDQVGLEESLTRPKLRATLEAHLIAICEGRLRKEDVLREMISYFSSSLSSTQNNLQVLLSSLQHHGQNGLFQPAPIEGSTDSARPQNPRDRRSRPVNQGPNPNRRDPGSDDDDDAPFKDAPRIAITGAQVDYDDVNNEANLNGPKCDCGQPSSRKVTKKPGPTKGRAFWSCADCNFFCWVGDEGTRGDLGKKSEKTITNSALPFCSCNEQAVRRVVVKAGVNHGREFVACAKPKGTGCTFFSWLEVSSGTTEALRPCSVPNKRTVGKFDHQIKCDCDMVSVRDETKSGANKGRIYYKCAKTIKKCRFFHWDDQPVDRAPPLPLSSLSYQQFNNDGDNCASITCYRCGEAGHFANACSGAKDFVHKDQKLQRKRPVSRGRGAGRSARGTVSKRQRMTCID